MKDDVELSLPFVGAVGDVQEELGNGAVRNVFGHMELEAFHGHNFIGVDLGDEGFTGQDFHILIFGGEGGGHVAGDFHTDVLHVDA